MELLREVIPLYDRLPPEVESVLQTLLEELIDKYKIAVYCKLKAKRLKELQSAFRFPKTLHELKAPDIKLPSSAVAERVKRDYEVHLYAYKKACFESLCKHVEAEAELLETYTDSDKLLNGLVEEAQALLVGKSWTPAAYGNMNKIKWYVEKMKLKFKDLLKNIEGEIASCTRQEKCVLEDVENVFSSESKSLETPKLLPFNKYVPNRSHRVYRKPYGKSSLEGAGSHRRSYSGRESLVSNDSCGYGSKTGRFKHKRGDLEVNERFYDQD